MVKVKDEWGDASECDNGDKCTYCHSRMELQFHPDVSPLVCAVYSNSNTYRRNVVCGGVVLVAQPLHE